MAKFWDRPSLYGQLVYPRSNLLNCNLSIQYEESEESECEKFRSDLLSIPRLSQKFS